MIPLGTAHLTVLDVGPPEVFDLVADAGYQKVGLRVHPAAPGGISYPLTKANVAAWRSRAATAGVGIFDVEFVPLTPGIRVDAFAGLLETAAELGARRLDVSGDDPDLDRVIENFGAMCDLAQCFGLGVDLEFMRWRHVSRLDQAIDVVTRAGRANGRILVDVLHLIRSGGSASDLGLLPLGLFGCVQLCDAPATAPATIESIIDEARQRRLPPGEGKLPLLEIINAVPDGVPWAVEVPMPGVPPLERARRGAIAARALLERWQPRR